MGNVLLVVEAAARCRSTDGTTLRSTSKGGSRVMWVGMCSAVLSPRPVRYSWSWAPHGSGTAMATPIVTGLVAEPVDVLAAQSVTGPAVGPVAGPAVERVTGLDV